MSNVIEFPSGPSGTVERLTTLVEYDAVENGDRIILAQGGGVYAVIFTIGEAFEFVSRFEESEIGLRIATTVAEAADKTLRLAEAYAPEQGDAS